jgi:OOP family OmpA-OmpF porin
MNKFCAPLMILLLVQSSFVLAQEVQKFIEVEGVIMDAETNTIVKSRIFYESLPYGNKVGVFNSETFAFKMEEGKSYSISIKADGYSTTNKKYEPSMAIHGVIQDTLYLAPTLVGKLVRLESLIFARANDHIPSSAYAELDHFVELMMENPNMLIQLEGHTDYRGDAKKNMELSESRVKITKDYFVDKGIDKKRIATIAFGGTQPIMRSEDPESYRQNRRVELRITQY